jgi:hypothetical protein
MMTKPTNAFENFIEMLVDELIAIPDEQVLEGQDPTAVQARGLELLGKAKAEAGRRRFAAAKAGAAALRSRAATPALPAVSVEEARRYIAQAANDQRYTLAARKLGEMSDDDVMRLFAQMKRLEDEGDPEGAPE